MIATTASGVPPEQGDLFEERGTWCEPAPPQQDIGDENFDDLSDKDLVEKTAKAKLSNVDLLCAKIVERSLGDIAVPGLVTLWNRFKGYGIAHPLPEQLLALETLSVIGNGAAKNEISKILAAWIARCCKQLLLESRIRQLAQVGFNAKHAGLCKGSLKRCG